MNDRLKNKGSTLIDQDRRRSRMEKISVLGIEYKIKRVPYILRDEYRAGQIDYEKQEIKILYTLKPDLAHVTLLHEVIHAALNHLGLHEETQNENLVQGLAIAMHQVIKYHKNIFSS